MNLKTSFLLAFTFFNLSLIAQQDFREFNTNDSTAYVLNIDTTIVVSKTKLYFQTNGALHLFSDFSTPDTTKFITDFDIITDSLWYLIFGGRYWGGPTTLYKTMDQGNTWVADSSYFSVTQPALDTGFIGEETLYQLQRISDDTLILFVSYYQSGIFYSVNAGQDWDLWFANLPANYRGLFECDDQYFLWGQEGDGFPGSMFSFSADLLLSPDTNNVWTHWTGSYVYHPDCYNANNPDCIFAPSSMTGYDQFLFFENYLRDNCSDDPVGIPDVLASDNLEIYPNPTRQGKFRLEWEDSFSSPIQYQIFAANGQLISSHKIQQMNWVDIDLSVFGQGSGVYFIMVKYPDKVITKRIVY